MTEQISASIRTREQRLPHMYALEARQPLAALAGTVIHQTWCGRTPSYSTLEGDDTWYHDAVVSLGRYP